MKNMHTTDKVVMFVDLLGFSSLTEAYPVKPELLRAYENPVSSFAMIFSAEKNELARSFSNFHSSLKFATDLAKMRHSLTAISFSDSAFFATTYFYEAANIAIDLIHSLLPQRIPVRIGIACGSFEATRFRSDVTEDGGDHAAHFLGTGVVRSHAAEACGIKGFRILLHPSTTALLENAAHNPSSSDKKRIRYLACASEERINTAGVEFEIDYWCFKRTAEAKAWHALQDMWKTAPQSELNHYQATAEAINRMRIGQGRAALKNLRRRILPR